MRVIGGDHLRDHAAHRGTDDVRALDPERVEQTSRVACHVVERVGCRRLFARRARRHDRGHVARTRFVEFVRQTDVAIVEGDDAEAAIVEHLDQRQRPTRHLARQAP